MILSCRLRQGQPSHEKPVPVCSFLHHLQVSVCLSLCIGYLSLYKFKKESERKKSKCKHIASARNWLKVLDTLLRAQIATDSMLKANNQRVSSTLNCPIHSYLPRFQSIDAPLPPPFPFPSQSLAPLPGCFPNLAFRPFPLSGLVPLLSPGHFQSTLDSSALTLFSNPFGPFESSLSLSPHIQS